MQLDIFCRNKCQNIWLLNFGMLGRPQNHLESRRLIHRNYNTIQLMVYILHSALHKNLGAWNKNTYP